MDEPSVAIRLEGNGRAHQPGTALVGEYWLDGVETTAVASVEVSVLWYTEGKGDEDLHIHEFWNHGADNGEPFDPTRPHEFRTMLPLSPLSYEGRIVKIRWCVRVRAFLHRGKEVFGQRVFRLGSVPPARPTKPAPPAEEAAIR